MIRFIRRFGTFKRPPPDYIFKRPVVKSDIDGSKMKQFPNYDVENEKWFDDDLFKKEIKDKWGKSLYDGKYGSSLYGPQDQIERQPSENIYNDRQD
jgi:hypothetical protein